MGLLQNDEMLSQEDTVKIQQILKEKGISYFFRTVCKYLNLKVCSSFTSGQEVELIALYKFNYDSKEFPYFKKFNNNSTSNQTQLPLFENYDFDELSKILLPQGFEVGHEYSNQQLEIVPIGKFDTLGQVINSISKYEEGVQKLSDFMSQKYNKEIQLVMASTYQMLGSEMYQRYQYYLKTNSPDHATISLDLIRDQFEQQNVFSKSRLTLDDHINPLHPRFKKLTECIRRFRGSPISIARFNPLTNQSLNLDSMMQGMGSNCFQYTFEVKSYQNACQLQDFQGVVSPLMLAISASTPILKGQFTDTDVRWNTISDSTNSNMKVSDGGEGEVNDDFNLNIDKRGCESNRPRQSSIALQLSNTSKQLNDVNQFKQKPVKDIFDKQQSCFKNTWNKEAIINHMEYSFSHPAAIAQNIDQSPDNMDWDRIHYLNLISSNWNSVRFKLPEENSESFKIEFRPLELQKDLNSNLLINCQMILLTRAFLTFKPCILIPISLVDSNMKTAHEIDSLNELQQFKDLDIKKIIQKFINENNMTEKDFDELCCFEDKTNKIDGKKYSQNEYDPDSKCSRNRRISAEQAMSCEETNLSEDYSDKKTLQDILFGKNGLDKLIQCDLAIQHGQIMPDSNYQFKNHLNCSHHTACDKKQNETLIECQEKSKEFMYNRVIGQNKTISKELREKQCNSENMGMLDMEDQRIIIEEQQLNKKDK